MPELHDLMGVNPPVDEETLAAERAERSLRNLMAWSVVTGGAEAAQQISEN